MKSRRSYTKYAPIDFEAASVLSLDVAARWKSLSEREREVARLLGEGKSDKEIAYALGISVKTVGFHNLNIFDKLGTRSRVKVAIIVQQVK